MHELRKSDSAKPEWGLEVHPVSVTTCTEFRYLCVAVDPRSAQHQPV